MHIRHLFKRFIDLFSQGRSILIHNIYNGFSGLPHKRNKSLHRVCFFYDLCVDMADSLLTNIWVSGWKSAFIDQITDTFILVLKISVLWILILKKEHTNRYTFHIDVPVGKFTSERQFTQFCDCHCQSWPNNLQTVTRMFTTQRSCIENIWSSSERSFWASF